MRRAKWIQPPGIYTLTYDYTDAAGNAAAQVTRTITVEDTTIPVITLNGDTNITHEAGDVYTDAGAVWNDIVDGEGNVTGVGEVNVLVPGSYTITFEHTDAAGNEAVQVTRTVNVVDTTIPVITIHGDANITHEAGDVYTDAGAVWNDIVDGEGNVTGVGEVNVLVPGSYTITFNHTDTAGNEAVQVTRTVNAVDTTIPVITLNGDANITHEGGSAYTDAQASWRDIVDGEGTVSATGEVDVMVPGIYVIYYNFTDSSGNAAEQVTRSIEVVDTTAPVIELLGEENMSIYVWTDFIDPWVEAYDAVDGNLTAQVEKIGRVLNDFPGEYDLAYVLTDSSGNRAQAVTRKVIVENRSPSGHHSGHQSNRREPARWYLCWAINHHRSG